MDRLLAQSVLPDGTVDREDVLPCESIQQNDVIYMTVHAYKMAKDTGLPVRLITEHDGVQSVLIEDVMKEVE